MKSNTRRTQRGTGLALAAVLAAGATISTMPAASAIPSAYNVIDRQPTGVTSDVLPTTQIDGIAWDQEIVDNTVFVGGEFTTARPAGSAPGVNTTPRANMLAYDITTGELNTAFQADTNARVNVIAVSPDKSRIYVGGAFTTIQGQNRWRIAAIDVATGKLVNTFQPQVDASVNSIVVTDSAVYVGGVFSRANGVARTRLAAFSPTDGSLLGWAPTANNNVKAMTLTPDQSRVIVGGQFSMLNGVASPGTGSLDATTGTLYPFALNKVVKNGTTNTGIYSLSTDGKVVIGTAFNYTEGVYEGVFMVDPYSGAIKWLADCHGDSYDATVMANQVYAVSHHHNCSNVGSFPQFTPDIYKRADAWTYDATTTVKTNSQSGYSNYAGNPAPSQIDWYPDLLPGSYSGEYQAAWTSESNDKYLVLGGEFPKVNGIGQQGLVRFAVPGVAPSKDGPVITGVDLMPAIAVKGTTATLSWTASWDRDNEHLKYLVYRSDNPSTPLATLESDSLWWDRPAMKYVDTTMAPSTTYNYWVVAVDGDGNRARGNNVQATSTAVLPADTYYRSVMVSNPAHYWRLGEASGSIAADSAGSANMTLRYATRNKAGILTGDTATSFAGTTSSAGGTTLGEASPNVFTSETWFKTTTTSGGMLLGFGSSSSGSSTSYDKQIYMTSAGNLAFGVNSGARRAVISPARYNDGTWHHVAAQLSSAGMKLFVDGQQVAQNASYTSGQAIMKGYWRLGGDSVTGWPSAPASRWFNGTLDESAVYLSALDAATIREHAATGGAKVTNTAPVASFTQTCTAEVCSFDGAASSDAESPVKSYAWDFGDGTTGTGAQVKHTYVNGGSFNVTLAVTDDLGTTGTTTQDVLVKLANKAPVAAFTTTVDALAVAVDGSTSTDDGNVEKYEWNFGDGSIDTGMTATHSYAEAGTYTVTLVATDNEGVSSTTTRKVTITSNGTVVAQDDFGTVETKWGTADTGGTWTYVQSAANHSTDGKAGLLTLNPGVMTNAQLAVQATDVVVNTDIAIDKLPAGGPVNVQVAARRVGTTDYRAKVRLLVDGSATIAVTRVVNGAETVLKEVAVPGGYTIGAPLHVQLSVTGTAPTTVAAKAWTGATEPATATVQASDSTAELQVAGGVGIVSYASAALSNGPVVVSIDNLVAVKSA